MDGPGHRPSLPTVLRPSSFARRRGVVAGPPPQQLGSLLTLPQVGDHGIVDSSLESSNVRLRSVITWRIKQF